MPCFGPRRQPFFQFPNFGAENEPPMLKHRCYPSIDVRLTPSVLRFQIHKFHTASLSRIEDAGRTWCCMGMPYPVVDQDRI